MKRILAVIITALLTTCSPNRSSVDIQTKVDSVGQIIYSPIDTFSSPAKYDSLMTSYYAEFDSAVKEYQSKDSMVFNFILWVEPDGKNYSVQATLSNDTINMSFSYQSSAWTVLGGLRFDVSLFTHKEDLSVVKYLRLINVNISPAGDIGDRIIPIE
jgi:hypothetical protein